MSGRTSIVEQLIQARADVMAITGEGCTALHKAAGGGYSDIVKILISAAGPMATQLVGSKHTAFESGHCLQHPVGIILQSFGDYWQEQDKKTYLLIVVIIGVCSSKQDNRPNLLSVVIIGGC
jgi:hypothetical protein